ncbi:hypothetical protein [Pilimelia anulata]|uniref:hypothetical protein n=1 Tax=Pilimelia anulata TaxID=53371 RepID=UPI001662DF0E|nr:hypothetical protein [Pilimelia anulata]
MTRTVVLLGASGRLGTAALPLYLAAGFEVVAVSRTRPEALQNGLWIAADLADHRDQVRMVTAVDRLTAGHRHVWLVDSALDRSGVDAMRRSIDGVTTTVLRLHSHLAARSRWCGLIAASTTAVLAPGLLQTPYGLAKRRQVITYARSGLSGVALLLPQLAAAPAVAGTCVFSEAATALFESSLQPPAGFSLRIPALRGRAACSNAAAPRGERSAAIAHLRSLLLRRNSMQAHRAAAHSRLRLTPQRLRSLVDHHLAPPELVRRFAHRYHLTVTDDRDSGLAVTSPGATHA